MMLKLITVMMIKYDREAIVDGWCLYVDDDDDDNSNEDYLNV